MDDAGAEVLGARLGVGDLEDHRRVVKGLAVEPGAGQRGPVGVRGARRKGEVDEPVRGEVGVEGEVEQATLPCDEERRAGRGRGSGPASRRG